MKTNLDPSDPMNMFRSAKPMIIQTPAEAKAKQRKHDEADLHLSYCSWLKHQYPKADFVRHEKEKKRSHFLGNLMKKYNSLDGLPDFELLERSGRIDFTDIDYDGAFDNHCYMYQGLYIEFKKPGEHWLEARSGLVKKAYQHQYECHCKLWDKGYCVYFCNDLDKAIELTNAYMNSKPLPRQLYKRHVL